jgi:hypothetical protein
MGDKYSGPFLDGPRKGEIAEAPTKRSILRGSDRDRFEEYAFEWSDDENGWRLRCLANSTLVSIVTARGIQQQFILIVPDRPPMAALILFAGGHGALGLKGPSEMKYRGNFLVRSRYRFADHGFVVAVIDAPSDHPEGMDDLFRMSRAHADDIDSVALYLKSKANIPVWLVGTSAGTFSAAGGAIASKNIDGLVLTSTVTRSRHDWKSAGTHPDGVASMALHNIVVSTLIVSHRGDACEVTPASDAEKLRSLLVKAKCADIALLDGGDAPRSGPCDAFSQHGFFGIEGDAIKTIASFIMDSMD